MQTNNAIVNLHQVVELIMHATIAFDNECGHTVSVNIFHEEEQ